MKDKSVSIRDVAALAGVSIGTVSHVLNENSRARISQMTQARVREAAESIGYRANPLARSLWRGKTDTVGLLISGFRNPFFVDVLEAAEVAVLERGFRVQPAFAPSVHGTFRQHADVFNWPVDGVIMWAGAHHNLATHMGPKAGQTPVVYIGALREDDTDWIGFDLYGGGRMLTEHMLRQGYRRPAYILPAEWAPGQEDGRFLAFQDVCREGGIEPRTILALSRDETSAAGLEMGLAIAQLNPADRPDAVFCHNDVIAIGMCAGLRRGGLQVPADVAVVGFDGIEMGQFLDAPLTTVRIPVDRVADEAMGVLATRILGENEPESRVQKILTTTLMVGGTT